MIIVVINLYSSCTVSVDVQEQWVEVIILQCYPSTESMAMDLKTVI